MQQSTTPKSGAPRRFFAQQAVAADAAFGVGDYKTARQLYQRLALTGGDTELVERAKQRAELLRTDPATMYAGFAAMLLVALASLWALSSGSL